jgi:tRNA(Ile)-lysidine synthase
MAIECCVDICFEVSDSIFPCGLECLQSIFWTPGIAEALARTASLLRDDADALDQLTDRTAQGHDLASLEIEFLAGLPKAIRTRLIRRAIYAQGAPMGSITADHVSAVEALITSWHGQGEISLPGGVKVARISGRLSAYARN